MLNKLFSRIKDKWSYEFNKQFKPELIGGYHTSDGRILTKTRISNTTHISNRSKLIIGDNVFIGHFNYIDSNQGVTIEEGCQVTNYISILTHSSHDSIRLYGNKYLEKFTELQGMRLGPVYIGKYTYVGAHSLIMPGTKIGKGCIISAYSYVDGQYPDYSILRGIPAQIIGLTKDRDMKLLKEFPDLKSCYFEKDI